MGNWSYQYDDVGNLKKQTDAKSGVIEFTYDDLDRVTLKDYKTDPTQTDVLFTYDGSNDGDATNPKGRLTGVTDAAGGVKYGYDARGNMTRFIRDYTFANKRFEFSYTYNNLNRPLTMTYPKQMNGTSIGTVAVTYTDSSNKQTPFVQKVQGDPTWPLANGNQVVQQGTTYDAFGNLTQYVDGSNMRAVMDYDPLTGQVKESTAFLSGGTPSWFHQKYTYDAATQFITSVQNPENLLSSQFFTGAGGGPGYDALGRLRVSTAFGVAGAPPVEAVNTYDAIGNILAKDVVTGSDAISKILSYTDSTNFASPHAVRKLNTKDNSLLRTYSYDANGNMSTRITGASTRAFVWDQDNRLVRVTENGGTLRNFTYDYTGERVYALSIGGPWQRQPLYTPTRDFEWSSVNQAANVFVFLGSVRLAVIGVGFTPQDIPVGGWVKLRQFGDAAGTAALALWPFLLMLLGLALLRWWTDPRRASVPVLARRVAIGALVLLYLHATATLARAIPPPYAGSIFQVLYYHADYKGSESIITGQNQTCQPSAWTPAISMPSSTPYKCTRRRTTRRASASTTSNTTAGACTTRSSGRPGCAHRVGSLRPAAKWRLERGASAPGCTGPLRGLTRSSPCAAAN